MFSSTTGFLNWKTQDVTDLDYTPRPLLTRDNTEKDFQFTQEIRFASADTAPIRLTDSARLRWQTGVFLFTQAYEQDAINNYAPFVVGAIPGQPAHAAVRRSTTSGSGVFGQGTVTFNDRLDLTAGARFDYEDKSATLENFFEPPILAGTLGRRRQELLERLAAGGARLPASSRTRRSTRPSGAATRPAGSTRRRRPAARRTARSRPGTSRAA